ncbi:hypothetical protein [Nannocystis pusilla]|uniref:hypothetical protein n=1 Tax=Nannocystis pusilla TaxID=889268 RepID=UPI003DA5D35A
MSAAPVVADAVAAEAMVGVLVPEAEVVLTAPEFARLERLDVQVGDRVREGDVVAALERPGGAPRARGRHRGVGGEQGGAGAARARAATGPGDALRHRAAGGGGLGGRAA